MIKDAQVRRLRQLLGEGHPLHLAGKSKTSSEYDFSPGSRA